MSRAVDAAGPRRGATFRPDRWAAARERPRAREDRWERIGDLYLAVVSVLTLAALAFGLVAGTTVLAGRPLHTAATGRAALVGTEEVLLLLAAVVAGAVLRVSAVLGPVAVDRAQGFWWLSLPVPATPFLWRALMLRVLAAGAAGALLGLVAAGGVAVVLSADGAPVAGTAVASAALVTGAWGLFLPSLAALAQATGRRRALRRVATVGPLLALAVLVPGVPSPPVPTLAVEQVVLTLVSAGVVAALAAGCLALARPRLDGIPPSELIAAGGAGAHAGAAMFLLDVRELAASLTDESPRSVRSRRRSRLLRGTGPSGPGATAVRADLLVIARTRGMAARLVLAAGLVLLVGLSEPGRSPVVLGLAVLACAVTAARAVRSAAEAVGDVQELARLLPLDHGTAWSVHTLAPAVLLVPWGAVVGLMVGLLAVAPTAAPLWLPAAVGTCTGAGLAGAAVRLGTQPSMDWGAVMQGAHTGRALGPIVTGLLHGTDTALLAAVPLAALPVLGAVQGEYLIVSAIVAGIAWTVGRHVTPRH